ncbi:acetoin utilization protein AcuC [Microlunatus sp. Y2014]|uniref:acetoin utilization protein AcuC n=1 Tax=Microlunatus sp. Y2014 TaxID=3418488 RepID=UPI003DA77BD4
MTAVRPAWILPETRYDFGDGHPMAPGRVHNTIRLATALGVLDLFDHVPAEPLDEALLRQVHTSDYIAAVRSGEPHPELGLGTVDNPIVPGLDEIARNVAAGTVEAARQVWRGPYRRAVNIAGGLHHAMPGATSGFCVYNDIGCAIEWLLAHGCERVVYLDVDAHHGDGVQAIFADEPRVVTISLHQTGAELFPGTGYAHETGGGDAVGTAVNVALAGGTDDAGWLRAFDAVVPEVLAEFAPQVIVSQHGCDSHRLDPLTDLQLSVEGQQASYQMIADWADEYADGRWVAVGGGGYAVTSVVPRAWTHLLAVMAGAPLDPATPIPDAVRAELGTRLPATMGDLAGEPVAWRSTRSGWDPASRLDQTVLATRKAAFPDLGLDPEF